MVPLWNKLSPKCVSRTTCHLIRSLYSSDVGSKLRQCLCNKNTNEKTVLDGVGCKDLMLKCEFFIIPVKIEPVILLPDWIFTLLQSIICQKILFWMFYLKCIWNIWCFNWEEIPYHTLQVNLFISGLSLFTKYVKCTKKGVCKILWASTSGVGWSRNGPNIT